MKKSIFSLALGCALALTALPSCENQMEGNLLPPPTVESNDSLVAVNFAPSVPLKERTRGEVEAFNPLEFVPGINNYCSVFYAIYEADGTLVKKNLVYRLLEDGLNFSEPLRRNHDYKVAVLVTPGGWIINDDGELDNADGWEDLTLDAEKKEIRYTDRILTNDEFRFNMPFKDYFSLRGNSCGLAVGWFYFGDINVPDGLGAAINRPITLTRPFCTVGVITDEFASTDFSWLVNSSNDFAFTSWPNGAPSRGGGESWAKFPIAYNFWNDQISEYKNSETGVIPNYYRGGMALAYDEKIRYDSYLFQGKEVSILGGFSFLAPKNSTADESLYLNICSEERDWNRKRPPILNEIHTKLNIGPNKMLQNNLILISNKPGTAFFTNTNNFQPTVNVDFVGSNDVVGTK